MNLKRDIQGGAGLVCAALLAFSALPAAGQMRSAMTGPVAPAGATAGGIKIRKLAPVKETTPAFKSSTTRGKEWWCARMEFETEKEWTDELEFTTYVYVEDQSNKNAPLMYKDVTTYVDLAKGRHLVDIFLHPDTFKKVGIPKYIAVVIRANGVVVGMESTAKTANWWDQFTPVEGVLLPRARTPFAVLDFDNYPCVKAETSRR